MPKPRPDGATTYRSKLVRELRAGLVGLTLLYVIDRTGPDYGYRILRHIQETSGGRLAFKEGTAYPVLQNLERAGFVTSFWGDGEAGPPRKYYQITREGRAALEDGLTQWKELRDSVDRIFTDHKPEARRT